MPPASADPRPALWPILAAYLAAFVVALGASVVFVLAMVVPRTGWNALALADESTKFALSAPGLLGAAFVDAVALLGGDSGDGAPAGQGRRRTALRLGPTRATAVGLVAAMVGMIGLSLACGAAVELLAVGQGGVMESISTALHSSSPVRLVLALLAIGVAPGVAEEAFFRGLIQTRLAVRWGRWPAIATSAAAFGLFHLDPVQGSLAFLAGVFLGWVVDRFGGIRPSIAAHAINNAMFVVFATLTTSGDTGTKAQAVGLLIGGAAACGAAIAVLRSGWSVRSS